MQNVLSVEITKSAFLNWYFSENHEIRILSAESEKKPQNRELKWHFCGFRITTNFKNEFFGDHDIP